MKDGDISNAVAPRYLFVYEGLVANLEPTDAAKRGAFLKLHRWKRAAYMWTHDLYMQKVFWDLVYRRDQSVDIVTYLDEREAEHVQERMDNEGYPFGNFIVTTIPEFTRGALNNPSVVGVFDADPSRRFTYGGKGLDLRSLP